MNTTTARGRARALLDRSGITTRTILIILLAASVALVLSVGRSLTQPQQHQATTTVFIGSVLPSSTTGDVDASIADFTTVVALPIVRDPVSKEVGISEAKLDAVDVTRIRTSSAVDISFTNSNRDLASKVVVALARQGLRTLAQQRVDAATAVATTARNADDAALKALSDFEGQLGVVDLAAEYQIRRQDLLSLQAQAANSPSPGLADLVNQRKAEVDRLAAALPQFNQLSDRLNEARAAVATASQSLTDAQAKLSAADSPSALTTPHITDEPRLLPAVRTGLIVFVTVAVLGLALALIQSIRQRRMTLWFEDRLDPFVGDQEHVSRLTRRKYASQPTDGPD